MEQRLTKDGLPSLVVAAADVLRAHQTLATVSRDASDALGRLSGTAVVPRTADPADRHRRRHNGSTARHSVIGKTSTSILHHFPSISMGGGHPISQMSSFPPDISKRAL